jgi:4,5-dihydroxyphthalate decarboxylase
LNVLNEDLFCDLERTFAMATNPRITLGLPDHPRCQAIIDGKVGVEGYELAVDPNFTTSGERHYKYLHGQWDVGEVSAASLLRAIEKGQPLLAIPVFFERGPRQRNIYHCEGKLKHPSELRGKKFGCFRYGATAVVWARGYLLDAHHIKTTDMQWFVSGREVFIGHELPVKVQRIEPPPPFGGEKLVLSQMLHEGELHGAIVPGDNGYAGFFGGGETPKMMAAYPGVKPLFDDNDEIIDYVKKTGINPIMHVLSIRREVAERHPDLPAKLTRAFIEARKMAGRYMSEEERAGYERERAVLGEDPYAYVMGENEKQTLAAMNRYQIEQGLMKTMLPIDDLFIGHV